MSELIQSLKSLIVIASFVLFSIYHWSAGYISVKVQHGELRVDQLPKGLQILWSGVIQRALTRGKQNKVPFIGIGIGILTIGLLLVLVVLNWYRFGFDQTVVMGGIGLFVWCLIVRWHLRLG